MSGVSTSATVSVHTRAREVGRARACWRVLATLPRQLHTSYSSCSPGHTTQHTPSVARPLASGLASHPRLLLASSPGLQSPVAAWSPALARPPLLPLGQLARLNTLGASPPPLRGDPTHCHGPAPAAATAGAPDTAPAPADAAAARHARRTGTHARRRDRRQPPAVARPDPEVSHHRFSSALASQPLSPERAGPGSIELSEIHRETDPPALAKTPTGPTNARSARAHSTASSTRPATSAPTRARNPTRAPTLGEFVRFLQQAVRLGARARGAEISPSRMRARLRLCRSAVQHKAFSPKSLKSQQN